MSVIIAVVAVLAAAAAGRAWGAWRGIEWGRHCPTCGRKSFPVAHQRTMWRLPRSVIRRWCPGCGWEGLRRRRYRTIEAARAGAAGFRWAEPAEEDCPLLWKDRDAKADEGQR